MTIKMASVTNLGVCFACAIVFTLLDTTAAAARPNIVFILADDLGWNDLSFHGSDQILTPNIDTLAFNGVVLNSHYVQPVCTPSRAALMTGMYPIHNGMQGMPILATEPRGLPKGKILPEYLKDLGYVTAAIGKWHLGYYREDFLPTNRGFDSHLGYYNGFVSYYDYILQDDRPNNVDINGFDLRRNLTPAYDLVGTYATDVFTQEAVHTIRHHDKRRPLFMYLSHLAVHAGNRGKFVEAPQEWINKFQHIADPSRRTYAAMVAKMDESVGKVVTALEQADMLHNTIIVLVSDNGAPTIGRYPNWGSNYPLKGMKETLWEGGVRGAGLIWSPFLNQVPRVSNELMHVTDWLPTLYAAAGGYPGNLPKMDGINQWFSLSLNLPSERNEILHNIDEIKQTAAIRMNSAKYHWKLVVGTVQNGSYDDYFGQGTNQPPENNPTYDLVALASSPTHHALESISQRHLGRYPTPGYVILQLRSQATIRCNYPIFNPKKCNPIENQICLYDLKNDPCELNNLTPYYSNTARYLFKALVLHRQTLVPQINRLDETELAHPNNFNGTWSTWRSLNGLPYYGLSKLTLKNQLDPEPSNIVPNETIL